MDSEELEMCWRNHNQTLPPLFDFLLSSNTFVDVTLACDGKQLHAHRLVLAACSDYLQELLLDNKNPHPIIYLKDVKYSHMTALLSHMYRGQFRIPKEELPELIRVAEGLKIRGIQEMVDTSFLDAPNINATSTLPLPNNSDQNPGSSSAPLTLGDGADEIPLLFYTELLQNSDMHELLAGKITQCLDSKNATAQGDEVVKAVSSIAEKEIVDAFFKDFFEIELGEVQPSVESNTNVQCQFSPRANQTNPQPNTPMMTPPSHHESETVLLVANEDTNLEETCSTIPLMTTGDVETVSVATEVVSPPEPSSGTQKIPHSPTATASTKRMRTVFTVLYDDTKSEEGGAEVKHSMRSTPFQTLKRKRTPSEAMKNYKKPWLVSSIKNETYPIVIDTDTWASVGRRSISPKFIDTEIAADKGLQLLTKPNVGIERATVLARNFKADVGNECSTFFTGNSKPDDIGMERSTVIATTFKPNVENQRSDTTVVISNSNFTSTSETTPVLAVSNTSTTEFLNTSNTKPLDMASNTFGLLSLTDSENPLPASAMKSPLITQTPSFSPPSLTTPLKNSQSSVTGTNKCEEPLPPTTPPTSTGKLSTSRRRCLSRILINKVHTMLEAEDNPSTSTTELHVTPTALTSLEKSTTDESLRVSRRKSYSTPRKRSQHVRNLCFKTPPSARDTGNSNSTHQLPAFQERRSNRELDFGMPNISSTPILKTIPETSFEVEVTPYSFEKSSVSSPVKQNLWVPPATPRILSPKTRQRLFGSPLLQRPPIQKSSAEPARDPSYINTLRRLLGSPLAPGVLPSTPGRTKTPADIQLDNSSGETTLDPKPMPIPDALAFPKPIPKLNLDVSPKPMPNLDAFPKPTPLSTFDSFQKPKPMPLPKLKPMPSLAPLARPRLGPLPNLIPKSDTRPHTLFRRGSRQKLISASSRTTLVSFDSTLRRKPSSDAEAKTLDAPSSQVRTSFKNED